MSMGSQRVTYNRVTECSCTHIWPSEKYNALYSPKLIQLLFWILILSDHSFQENTVLSGLNLFNSRYILQAFLWRITWVLETRGLRGLSALNEAAGLWSVAVHSGFPWSGQHFQGLCRPLSALFLRHSFLQLYLGVWSMPISTSDVVPHCDKETPLWSYLCLISH